MNSPPALRPDITLAWLNELGTEYLPGFLGVEMLELTPGRLRSQMKLAQQHFAPNNFLHAASIVALADTTCGYATIAHLPEGAASFTTIELKSNHLGTVREGALLCAAHAQAPGSHDAGLGRGGDRCGQRAHLGAVPVHADDPLAENAVRRPQHRAPFGDRNRTGGLSSWIKPTKQ
jgi:uncharacterized protein (TIGR00369 family)